MLQQFPAGLVVAVVRPAWNTHHHHVWMLPSYIPKYDAETQSYGTIRNHFRSVCRMQADETGHSVAISRCGQVQHFGFGVLGGILECIRIRGPRWEPVCLRFWASHIHTYVRRAERIRIGGWQFAVCRRRRRSRRCRRRRRWLCGTFASAAILVGDLIMTRLGCESVNL